MQKEEKHLYDSNVQYAVLMETSGEECESWYYCIRYQGNENNLKHLERQLNQVEWFILGDLSTFDLDLKHLISAETARDLIRLDLNHYSHHRKFDGVLDVVDLHFDPRDKTEKKMVKAFDLLGYGQIEDYIEEEDIPSESSDYEEDEEDDEDYSEDYSEDD